MVAQLRAGENTREVVGRRYRRLQAEDKPLPGLVLIDGGVGQLHAAAEALEQLGIINQPLANIAPTIFFDFNLRYIVLDYWQMPPGPERDSTEQWLFAALPNAAPPLWSVMVSPARKLKTINEAPPQAIPM